MVQSDCQKPVFTGTSIMRRCLYRTAASLREALSRPYIYAFPVSAISMLLFGNMALPTNSTEMLYVSIGMFVCMQASIVVWAILGLGRVGKNIRSFPIRSAVEAVSLVAAILCGTLLVWSCLCEPWMDKIKGAKNEWHSLSSGGWHCRRHFPLRVQRQALAPSVPGDSDRPDRVERQRRGLCPRYSPKNPSSLRASHHGRARQPLPRAPTIYDRVARHSKTRFHPRAKNSRSNFPRFDFSKRGFCARTARKTPPPTHVGFPAQPRSTFSGFSMRNACAHPVVRRCGPVFHPPKWCGNENRPFPQFHCVWRATKPRWVTRPFAPPVSTGRTTCTRRKRHPSRPPVKSRPPRRASVRQ